MDTTIYNDEFSFEDGGSQISLKAVIEAIDRLFPQYNDAIEADLEIIINLRLAYLEGYLWAAQIITDDWSEY